MEFVVTHIHKVYLQPTDTAFNTRVLALLNEIKNKLAIDTTAHDAAADEAKVAVDDVKEKVEETA